MTNVIIAFVVALLCSGVLVTTYILWLAKYTKPQIFYDEIVRDAIVLKRVESWLEEEIIDNEDVVHAYDNNQEPIMSDNTDEIMVGRHEVADSLKNMINKWRSEL